MSPPTKRQLKKGAAGFGYNPEDAEFLKIDRDPWDASASGEGYNARFKANDDAGTHDLAGHGVDGAGDNSRFMRAAASQTRTDESVDNVHERLAGLIDDSQPYDPRLPGGAPLTQGKGVGTGKPRYSNPPPASAQGNMRKPR